MESSSPSGVERRAWVATLLHYSTPLAIIVAALIVSGSIVFVGTGGNMNLLGAGIGDQGDILPQEEAPIVIEDYKTLVEANDPVIGKADAPVTIVEFSDFQCPFCRRFYEDSYGQIKKDYIDTGKVRLVFRDYPLPFHEAAKPAAMAAQCANDQGKFEAYHDKIFEEQAKKGTGTVQFTVADLKAWAVQIGLNAGTFNSCLDSQKYAAEVDADTEAAGNAGVSGTPSFFVNGTLVVGAQPYSTFQAAIEAALK
jgi:protein-disulfide isomerase